jgi:hypothetical protein
LAGLTPWVMAQPVIPALKYEKIVFIHCAGRDPAKPQPSPVDNTAYKLIGPKWSTLPAPYVAPNGAVNEIKLAFEAWDAVSHVSSAVTEKTSFYKFSSPRKPMKGPTRVHEGWTQKRGQEADSGDYNGSCRSHHQVRRSRSEASKG